MTTSNPVVFYDSECSTCNYWVQWILDRDNKRSFRFAALQSRFAEELFAACGRELTTRSLVVLTEDGEFLSRSSAVSFLFSRLRPYSFFGRLIKRVPRFLADVGYDGVANARKLTRKNRCRLFTADERAFFLNHIEFSAWANDDFRIKKENSFPREEKKV